MIFFENIKEKGYGPNGGAVYGFDEITQADHIKSIILTNKDFVKIDVWPLPQTLIEVKNSQVHLLTSSYQSTIYADIQYTTAGGVTQTFQADAGSQNILIQQLAVYVTAGGVLPTGYAWTAKDNSQLPFTIADLKGLAAAIGDRGATAFFKLQTLKAKIRSLAAATGTTVDDIQAVTW